MLFIFTIASFICATTAGVVDLNCTKNDGTDDKFTKDAIICSNKAPEIVCTTLYGAGVKEGDKADTRDAKCLEDNGALSQILKESAISTCPKSCGYCCETPAYKCENSKTPSVPCDTVTDDMCKHALWKPILMKDCPKTCGLCDAQSSGCLDTVPGCTPAMCTDIRLQDFVKEYCKKTCNLCDPVTTPAPTPGTVSTAMPATTAPSTVASTKIAGCGSDSRCAAWIKSGFCSSPHYSLATILMYCGIPCGLC